MQVPSSYLTTPGTLTARPSGTVSLTYSIGKGTVGDISPGALEFAGTVQAPAAVPAGAKCGLSWQLQLEAKLATRFTGETHIKSTNKNARIASFSAKSTTFSVSSPTAYNVTVPFSFTVQNPLSLIGVSCTKPGTTINSSGFQLTFPRLFLSCFQSAPGNNHTYNYLVNFPEPNVSFSVKCAN